MGFSYSTPKIPSRYLESTGKPSSFKEKLEDLARLFELYFPTPALLTIDLDLYDLEQIAQVNQTTRKVTGPTDVLSFPTVNSFSEADTLGGNGELNLGSILVCPDYAAKQGTPLLDLVFHGTLHLLGYDHEQSYSDWALLEQNLITSPIGVKLRLKGLF